ncbi:cell division cycle protein 27 homolog B isoform X3 [Capsicum annuum]|uniref:cell division cycle protein 27 homolog B isoform X3 n=1 Tax=Capsicum annuum TaxID=4072 RepID=UPI001FB0CD73|nr:cell division cycle protein 27 homolog B isoform X3 [Capsicum annuum]
MSMESVLIECVQNSLVHFMHHNAIFMCERLCAEFPSETNMQLLAGCYLQNQQAYAAYHVLKGTSMAQSRYLFALSCFQMGLLTEAETALCPPNEPAVEVPNGAAGHYLLGLIYRYTDRRKISIQHFNQALLLDPLLWAAYEELCILGAAEEAAVVFGEASLLCIEKQHLYQGNQSRNFQASTDDQNVASKNIVSDDISPRQSKHTHSNNLREISGNYYAAAIQNLGGASTNMSFYNTPSPMASQLSGVVPPPVCRNFQQIGANASVAGADNSPRSTVNSTIQAPRRKFVDEGKLRKISGRLFPDSGPRRNSRLAGESTGNTNPNVSAASGNGTIHSSKYYGSSKLSSMTLRSMTSRKAQSWATENYGEGIRNDISDDSRLNMTVSHSSGDARPLEQEGPGTFAAGVNLSSTSILSGASEILTLFRILGEGYRLSCLYRCQDALDAYNKLPHKHYHTGWVLSQHLKEDMKLSYLAQELVSTDRLAPQSWCAMGNCYSLQKDHETALKNFQRAVQVNPRFAYGHTLCGHEYIALEDFENAIKSYQSALRVDARHYNAWYGLGMIYLRQEKFEFSEHHFRMALGINPHSSVIMSYLGTSLHALKKNEEALEVMELAVIADKKNPFPMYQKANILVSMESFDAALDVLEELKEHAPRESSVYALMGRIYKRCNMYDKAMLHFGVALDLRPSATDVATIKVIVHLPTHARVYIYYQICFWLPSKNCMYQMRWKMNYNISELTGK